MGGFVIVSEIGSQITFIRDNLPIKQVGKWPNRPAASLNLTNVFNVDLIRDC